MKTLSADADYAASSQLEALADWRWQHLLEVTFCARPMPTLWRSKLNLKLPVPGRIATASHTRGTEYLCLVAQFTVSVNLLHVGDSHATIPAGVGQHDFDPEGQEKSSCDFYCCDRLQVKPQACVRCISVMLQREFCMLPNLLSC